MNQVLFNFHDMIHFVTAVLAGLLAVLLCLFPGNERRLSHYLLGAVLLMYAVIALDKLVTYSEEVRYVLLEHSTNWFLWGNAALLLEAPLLYGYVRTVADKRFRLEPKHLLHLVPCLLYLVYVWFLYYRYDELTEYRLMVGLGVYDHWTFKYFYLIRDSLRVAYGVAGIYVLFEYQRAIRQRFSEIDKIDMQWLVIIVVGFLLYRAWMFIESVYSAGVWILIGEPTRQYLHVMALSGLVSSYMAFFLVVMLVFFGLRYSLLLEGVELVNEQNDDDRPLSLDWKAAKRVIEFMQNERPYLEHNITIDALAGRLGMPTRTLSLLLNRHFGKNFFEYINGYRVEHAKALLCEHPEMSVVDVMHEAGFSSKSSFNDCFKKLTGMTPREYRKRCPAKGAAPTAETSQA
ncbi:MAG: hypothetical protein KatS3mg121_1184 [Gammaproteobacteria bacterium]|nr:MAG: hypothetical protein KatS3mg121_1184 [Gammaproteobacteria bacterium]